MEQRKSTLWYNRTGFGFVRRVGEIKSRRLILQLY